MSAHEYTPQQALDLLMTRIRRTDESLAIHVQAAIDAGMDVVEAEPATERRKKPRHYRKKVPYSLEQALQVAVDALRAYFIEQPLFANSACENFIPTAVGTPALENSFSRRRTEGDDVVVMEREGEKKRIEIELKTETQITPSAEDTFPLQPFDSGLVEAQSRNLDHVRKQLDFTED